MKKATKKPGNHKYGPHTITAATKLAKKGCTNEGISDYLGIALDTFYTWRKKYPEFDEAISDARLGDLDKVEAAVMRRALGFSYDETTTETMVINGTEVGEKKVRVTNKTIAPSETAQKYILSNRRKSRWAEKIEAEVTGGISIEIGLPDSLKTGSGEES